MLQFLKFVVLSCLTFIQGILSLNKVDILVISVRLH